MSISCSKGNVFVTGDEEEKGRGHRPFQNAKDSENEKLVIAVATYEMTVTGNNGTQLCKGNVVFTFATDRSVNPVGDLECIPPVGTKRLGEVFKERGGEVVKEDMKRYPGFDKFTRVPNPSDPRNGPVFEPPRPDQLGPIIKRHEIYDRYYYEEPTKASYMDKRGRIITDEGIWKIRVLKINSSVEPTGYTGGEVFNKVIEWEINLEGMNKIPKGEINAYETFIYYYNTDPIRVPKIIIKSKLSDMMPGFLSKIGDALFSGVTIELNLRDWKPGI